MKTLALPLSLLLLSPAPTFAGNYQNSGTSANECEGAAKACSAAAKELKAARDLIKGYEAHIAAADERIAIAYKEIETLKQAGQLEESRAAELQKAIAAEQAAKSALVKLKDEQSKRIVKLEKQLGRAHKFALIAGVAALVAILIGSKK